MSRTKKLRDFNAELKRLDVKIKTEEPKRIGLDGKIDMDVMEKVQLMRNNIYLLKKKIGFLKKGKSSLGNKFGSINRVK